MHIRTLIAIFACAACASACNPEEVVRDSLDADSDHLVYTRDETVEPPICTRIRNSRLNNSTEVQWPCEDLRNRKHVVTMGGNRPFK